MRGALAYKLSKPDTEKIEQHTGVPVEEMTDEELQQAVDELNLRTEPLDASDQAYIAEQDDGDADAMLTTQTVQTTWINWND